MRRDAVSVADREIVRCTAARRTVWHDCRAMLSTARGGGLLSHIRTHSSFSLALSLSFSLLSSPPHFLVPFLTLSLFLSPSPHFALKNAKINSTDYLPNHHCGTLRIRAASLRDATCNTINSEQDSFRFFYKECPISVGNTAALSFALPPLSPRCFSSCFPLQKKSSSRELTISRTPLLSFHALVFIESPRSVVFTGNDDDDPRAGRRPMITRVMRVSYRLLTPIPVSLAVPTLYARAFHVLPTMRGTRFTTDRRRLFCVLRTQLRDRCHRR